MRKRFQVSGLGCRVPWRVRVQVSGTVGVQVSGVKCWGLASRALAALAPLTRHLTPLLLLALSPLTWQVTPARAQGTVGSLTCIKRDRAAILRWVISPVISDDAVRCKYDYDAVSLDRQNKQVNAASANGGRRQCVIYDLAPDDDVYLGPQTSDSTKTLFSPLLSCSGACTNCDVGDDSFFGDDGSGGSGCDCGGAGEYPKIHTAVEDTDPDPDPPLHTGLTTPPTVTPGGGHTFTVASNCSDFASKKAAAETDAADGDVAELVLPAGVACTTSGFNLTSIANGGWVLVKSGADPKLLPPPGAMTDKTYLPFLGVITWSAKGAWGYHDELITADNNARGYYFSNINIGPPALGSPILDPVTATISSIDVATDTITVPSTVGLLQQGSFGASGSGEVVVLNLEGSGVRGGYGPMHACNITSTTFKLYTGVTNKGCFGGTLVNLTGANCSSNCGTVRRFIALPIESHGESAGNHSITITGHGIPNFPDMTITAGTTSTITVTGTPSEYQIANNTVVHVEGTGNANCDGLRNAAVSGSVLTLSRTGQTTNCGGVTNGTAHRHRAVSIVHTDRDTLGDHEPQVHNVERVDADTLQILELSAQAGAAGGYLFWDMETMGTVVQIGTDARSNSVEDVVFDRVISLACLPWLSSGWGGFGNVQHVGVINSHIEHCMWQRVNPVNDQIEKIHGLFQGPSIQFRGAEDFYFRNNFSGPQDGYFADDNSNAPDTSVDDLSLTGNYVWFPDWTTKSTGVWRNHYFHKGFPIELKSAGTRIAISGNYWKGWMSDFQQTAPAIAIAVNGSNSSAPNGPSHLAVEHNIFDRGASILQLASDTSIRAANKLFNFTEKLRFAGNLGVRIDTTRYTADPSNAAGLFIQATSGYRDFVIERNTFLPERAVNPRILDVANHRSSGMRILDNILGFTEGSNTNRLGVVQATGSGQIPAETEDGGYAAFQEFHVRGAGTDPLSEISGNIAIPMLKNSSAVSDYATAAASTNPAVTHCQSSLSTEDKMLNLPLTYVGNTHSPCDESLNQRLALSLQNGSFAAAATYAGKGVDLGALSDAQGLPGPVAVVADHDSATLSFHAPTTDGCAVDLAPWAGTWAETWDEESDITRGVDPSPDQEQVVTFAGLNPTTTYAYRGHCKRGFIGQFTTAGAP